MTYKEFISTLNMIRNCTMLNDFLDDVKIMYDAVNPSIAHEYMMRYYKELYG